MEDKKLSPKMEKTKAIILSLAIGVLIILVILIFIKLTYPDKTKIENFNNNQELICVGSEFRGKKFVVSKKRGWKIYNDDYVAKDDFVIELRNCE